MKPKGLDARTAFRHNARQLIKYEPATGPVIIAQPRNQRMSETLRIGQGIGGVKIAETAEHDLRGKAPYQSVLSGKFLERSF